MSLGVENITKCLDVAIEAGNVFDKIKNEKGSGMAKAAHAMSLFDELMALTSVDFSLLDDEYKDLDAAERTAIAGHLKSKFDIASDKAEKAIEDGFLFLIKAESLVAEAIALIKSFKAEEVSA